MPITPATLPRSRRSHRIALFAAIAIATLARVALADGGAATRPSSAQLRTQLAKLEKRIDQLQSNDAVIQKEQQAALAQVVAEADSNSKLMSIPPQPLDYTPEQGLVFRSDDGTFSIHPSALVQFRYVATYRQNVSAASGSEVPASGDDIQSGFEITRLRFSIDGNVLSSNIYYYLQFADDQGAATGLLDAYVLYRVSNQSPLALKAGQFKDPVWHEQNILESNLLAADRSLVDDLIGGSQTTRVQGLALILDQDNFRGQVVVHDGYNSLNTKFVEAGGQGAEVGAGAGVTPTNFGLTVRAEYLAIGDRTPEFNPFSEYDQFTAMNDRENILVLGGGADYSQSGSDNVSFHTLDAQYDTVGGWGFYAAYLGAYRSINTNKGVAPGSYYDSGFLAQASYMLTSAVEPFVRYDYTHLDGRAIPGIVQDNVHEITLGANYYFHSHQAKATLDGTYLPNGSPTDADPLGILKSDGRGEVVIRAQFQLQI